MTVTTSSDNGWSWKINELRKLLAQPLPGGRGFQHQRDQQIQRLCYEIGTMPLPTR